jgi:hypothetical protein
MLKLGGNLEMLFSRRLMMVSRRCIDGILEGDMK